MAGVLLASRWKARGWPLTALLALAAVPVLSGAPRAAEGPLEPAAALAAFQVDEGLAVELVACEPAVVDPVAMRFDEDGRLWVVEMRDYPHGPPEGRPPLSRIRLLADDDGDGRYENAVTFADQLLFPTGLQPWQGGLIVTLAGEVVYLKDADGDGRAELRETWFTGFTQENPQLRANHPRFGLDNRVTVANGLRGGTIRGLRQPDAPQVSISGRDFRFDPRSGAGEAVSGNGQFGLTFDDFGNRFVCSNRQPAEHIVLANSHLARNPLLAVPGVVAAVAAGEDRSRVFPLTSAWTTSNLHGGQFTAACGVTLYRDAALGDAYRGNLFVCEPTGSLVHRETVVPHGVTFVAQPASPGREFLASRDPWFRPVNLEIGPDGALYVVDMYRAVIEHPQFMPGELQQRPDLRWGDDRGRIYRIVRAGRPRAIERPRLSSATTRALVAALEQPGSWWRETASRLLYERQDPASATPLIRLVETAAREESRVAALGALAGQGLLDGATLHKALADAHARVREQAVVLAEPLAAGDAALAARLAQLASDTDPRVRFSAALALGGLTSSEAIGALARVALVDVDDAWTRRAVETARPELLAPILAAVLASPRVRQTDAEAELQLVSELAVMVGTRGDRGEVAGLLTQTVKSPRTPADEAALAAVAEGLSRHGGLLAFVAGLPEPQSLQSRLATLFADAATAAIDEERSEAARERKLALLKHASDESATAACLAIVAASPVEALRRHALAALAGRPGNAIAEPLLAGYAAQLPTVRRAIVDALSVDPAAARALLEAVAAGEVARVELDAARENRLTQHRDAGVRELAQRVLARGVAAERSAVLADYQDALTLDSDPLAGQALFRQHCAGCHRIGDVGVDVAPDISDSRVKTPAQLLTDILHPNQAIDNNYVSYTVATRDGNVHTGIISAETAGSVTLRQQENKQVSLLRADIEEIRTSGVSLMPEGFEKHLSRQQMADLIGFVKNWRYLDASIPVKIGAGGGGHD